jgi:threonine/homoserine/homoserine lactone efflux protein
MHAEFLMKGVAIGLSIAAPVGPIGVLCIRRSLRDGMGMGLITGLGAATADAAYGCVAGFGLTAVSGFLIRRQAWIGLIGGVFLCYLGVRTLLSRPSDHAAADAGGTRALAAYGSTLLLTLANPATILSFAVVFAAFGLGAAAGYAAAATLVLGVFLGSALWWLILSGGVGLVRSRVNPLAMRMINLVSGSFLVAFGIYALTRW